MTDTQPISKRSRRLLQEIHQHLVYAHRGIDHLSLDEYRRLSSTVVDAIALVDLPSLLANLRWLTAALERHLEQRS